jgi:hypothetical protein
VPDISTWQGRYQRRGAVVPGFGNERNELYEVKPDTIWGEINGKRKLQGMEENFVQLGIAGYKYGSWYPDPPGPTRIARKQIGFQHYRYVQESFRFRLDRMERSLRNIGRTLKILGVMLEIERREAGLLYYMICVQMRLDFQGEEAVAKKVVLRLYEAMTTGLIEQQAKLELEFANALAPATRDHKARPPQVPDREAEEALRVMAREEQFQIRKLNLVEELQSSVISLGNTLFSKLRGLPGERFLVCCDEVYFNNEIMNPRKIRLGNILRPLQLRPPLIMQYNVAAAGAMVKVGAPVIATAYVIGKITHAPQEIFYAREHWTKARDWLDQHPAATLIVGSALVYGTALLLAGGGVTVAAALYAEGAVTTGGAVGLQTNVGTGLARALASESIAPSALPAIERQVSERFAVEAARELAAKETDALLSQELRKLAEREAERIIIRQAAKEFQQQVAQRAISAGGKNLAAVALRMALPGAAVGAALGEGTASASTPVALEVGSLFLLKLRDGIEPRDLPLELSEYDYTKFSDEAPRPDIVLPQEMGGKAPPTKVWHLGVLECL